jgi:hypothetical protein
MKRVNLLRTIERFGCELICHGGKHDTQHAGRIESPPPPSYFFQNSCPRINKVLLALPETNHGELPSSAEQIMTIDGTADN